MTARGPARGRGAGFAKNDRAAAAAAARGTEGSGGGPEESGLIGGVRTALTATRRHGNSGAQINGRKVENLRKPNSRARRATPRWRTLGGGGAAPGTASAYRTAGPDAARPGTPGPE